MLDDQRTGESKRGSILIAGWREKRTGVRKRGEGLLMCGLVYSRRPVSNAITSDDSRAGD